MRSRSPDPSPRPSRAGGRHRRVAATHPAVVYAPALILSAAVAVPAVLGIGQATARSTVASTARSIAHAAVHARPAPTAAAAATAPPDQAGALRAERALRHLAPTAPARHRPAWVRPDVGRLTSGYGYRPSMGDFHPGIDLAGPYGSPIRAAAAGRVVFAGPASGFGQMIRIRHAGGIVTVYGHMSRILVRHGVVRAGQVIALEGSEGRSTGPHLHFEVWVRGRRVDPLPFLRRHGVRIR